MYTFIINTCILRLHLDEGKDVHETSILYTPSFDLNSLRGRALSFLCPHHLAHPVVSVPLETPD